MQEHEMIQLPCTHISHGIRVNLDWDYHALAHYADRTIAELTAAYPRAARLYACALTDPQALALWDVTGYAAIEKMGYNDHGQMHAQIVAANALQLLALLNQAGIEPDVVASGAGTTEDAIIAVLAAALLHDVGNQVARANHEVYSVMLAQPILANWLSQLYDDPVQRQILTGFILSAIASHDCTPAPFTLEGSIVAVADAADMTKGRGRVAFDQGKADIHAISAMAIEQVTIQPGTETPAHIEVVMSNPAGLFQVEKLLGYKLTVTGLAQYVSLRACVTSPDDADAEALHCLVFRQARFVPETVAAVEAMNELVDPVCGMAISANRAAGQLVFQGRQYHFCSNACLARFQAEPQKYT